MTDNLQGENKAGLFKKLATITQKMKRIPKSGRHPQGYQYATETDIVSAVSEALAEENVAILSSMISYNITEAGLTNGGKAIYHTICEFEFTFVCGDTGASLTQRWFNEALDSSDKGFNKVATAALKYFLMKNFLITTGEPDIHEEGDVQVTPKPTEEQLVNQEKSRLMRDFVGQDKPYSRPEELGATIKGLGYTDYVDMRQKLGAEAAYLKIKEVAYPEPILGTPLKPVVIIQDNIQDVDKLAEGLKQAAEAAQNGAGMEKALDTLQAAQNAPETNLDEKTRNSDEPLPPSEPAEPPAPPAEKDENAAERFLKAGAQGNPLSSELALEGAQPPLFPKSTNPYSNNPKNKKAKP